MAADSIQEEACPAEARKVIDALSLSAPLLSIDWILIVVALWLIVGVAGVLRPHSFRLVAHVLFPIGAALSLILAGAAVAAIFSGPQVAVLPLGLPKRALGGRMRFHAIRDRNYGLTEPLLVLAPERRAAESFLDDLICRGRVDMRAAHGNAEVMAMQPFIRKTHVMVRERGKLVLRRRMFDCGL